MRIVYYTHSLRSCWNHGNAHFLRGVLRELQDLGHDVVSLEPERSWSFDHLIRDGGVAALDPFLRSYPELKASTYGDEAEALAYLDSADFVLVHEWNEPALVASIGRVRAGGGRFQLLFHDTHHRAVSDPDAIRMFDLSAYDGVLAFGERLAEVYRDWGWGRRVHVWHEAADTRLFRPMAGAQSGCVWIGNWGDGERTQELQQFLFDPIRATGIPLDIYGVRYPETARAALAGLGASYHGWLPNAAAPEVFAAHRFTVHVPRRFYTQLLPGIPTIRVFEALACGIPLISAPWDDAEHLFEPGTDYLVANDGTQMERCMRAVTQDDDLRRALVASGLARIEARHTCRHRAEELLAVHATLAPQAPERLSA